MSTRDIDADETGLPVPGREHDPPRSQALEEPETYKRPLGCQCTTEEGDSPCPVHVSPDDAPAQKLPCEPSAIQDGADDAGKLSAPVDLVERLAELSWNASAPGMWRFIPEYRKDVHRAHVRAILAELAAMGGEALGITLGRHEVETGVYHGDYNQERETAWACNSCGYLSGNEHDPCDRPKCATRVTPILAAKDATNVEQARELSGLQNTYEDEREERRMLTAYVGDLEKERDAATKEADRMQAENAILATEVAKWREIARLVVVGGGKSEEVAANATKEAERLQTENAALTDLAQKLGTLSAMLNTLGLPDEPKALAREIMGRSKGAEALRAKVAELEARVRILEIAPKAVQYADKLLGLEPWNGSAEQAVRVITNGRADEDYPNAKSWSAAVLEYAAKARET